MGAVTLLSASPLLNLLQLLWLHLQMWCWGPRVQILGAGHSSDHPSHMMAGPKPFLHILIPVEVWLLRPVASPL